MEVIILFLVLLVLLGFLILLRLLANMDNILGKVMLAFWKFMIKCYELMERIPFVGFICSICIAYMRFVDRKFGKPGRSA